MKKRVGGIISILARRLRRAFFLIQCGRIGREGLRGATPCIIDEDSGEVGGSGGRHLRKMEGKYSPPPPSSI